jgi:hypothetical protein
MALRVVNIRFHEEAQRIATMLEKMLTRMIGRDKQPHSFTLAVQGSELDIPTSETPLVTSVKRKTLRICAVLVIDFGRLIVVVNKPNHFLSILSLLTLLILAHTKARHAGATKNREKYTRINHSKNKRQKIAEQNSTQKTATKKEK